MGIQDRDYMREQQQPGNPAPKILGLPRAAFLLCAAILVAFGVWKSGVLDKFIPDQTDQDKKSSKTEKGPKAATPAWPININSASFEDIKALPDIDSKIAEDILKRRPFKTVDDLLEVNGIGKKKLEKIRDKVKVE